MLLYSEPGQLVLHVHRADNFLYKRASRCYRVMIKNSHRNVQENNFIVMILCMPRIFFIGHQHILKMKVFSLTSFGIIYFEQSNCIIYFKKQFNNNNNNNNNNNFIETRLQGTIGKQ